MADGYSVPQINFSTLAQLPQLYQQAQQQATLSDLGRAMQGGQVTPQQAAGVAIGAGQPAVGINLLQLEEAKQQHAAQQAYQQASLAQEAALRREQMAQTARLASPEAIGAVERAKLAAAEEYAPKTVDINTPSGEKLTVVKTKAGFALPDIAGLEKALETTPVPPGADPKTFRAEQAKAQVKNQQDAVLSAAHAAEFQPLVDQAVTAYERAIKLGAIGPIAANPALRIAQGYGPWGNAQETARQDYERSLRGLQARIVAAQNKGEGQVSNFERQMYAQQFPGLSEQNPADQIKYLQHLQAQTRQTVSVGKSLNLAQAPSVAPRMEAPPIEAPGYQAPPRTQPPPVTNAQEAAQATAAAKAAVAAGRETLASANAKLRALRLPPLMGP